MPRSASTTPGRRCVFWAVSICLLVLFVTGFAVLAAVVRRLPSRSRWCASRSCCTRSPPWCWSSASSSHVYAAIWVKGIDAGDDTRHGHRGLGARKHHRAWYREMTAEAARRVNRRRDDRSSRFRSCCASARRSAMQLTRAVARRDRRAGRRTDAVPAAARARAASSPTRAAAAPSSPPATRCATTWCSSPSWRAAQHERAAAARRRCGCRRRAVDQCSEHGMPPLPAALGRAIRVARRTAALARAHLRRALRGRPAEAIVERSKAPRRCGSRRRPTGCCAGITLRSRPGHRAADRRRPAGLLDAPGGHAARSGATAWRVRPRRRRRRLPVLRQPADRQRRAHRRRGRGLSLPALCAVHARNGTWCASSARTAQDTKGIHYQQLQRGDDAPSAGATRAAA